METTATPVLITGFKEMRMTSIQSVRIDQEIPTWASSSWTLRKGLILLTWWLMCMILPPLSIILGGVLGMISGLATGMVKGAVESYNNLKQWWEIFENS
jgi:hypothetical protein